MKVYLVGGAVRDELLGLEVTEHDWVVVGAVPDDLLKQGYKQVGKSFPVFLHPETADEYALARKEKKTGQGYYGFDCDFAPTVTLEEDLERRDLTINAMAKAEDGTIIDPYNGQQDLKDKVLRHVSDAFVEDPVRLIRVARFMARYAPMGFKVADETMGLLQQMVSNGEIDNLIPERVWAELEKSLKLASPVSFIRTLRQSNALKVLFPELDRLYGVPQVEKHHPEIDTGIHVEMVLEQATTLSQDPIVRFASLVHDLGKGTTRADILPQHIAHEERGAKLIQKLCERLKIPNDYRDLAVLVAKQHGNIHRAFDLNATTIVKLFESMDLYRKPERLEPILTACKADAKGRKGFEDKDYPQYDYLLKCFEATLTVDIKAISSEFEGKEIKKQIYQARVGKVKALMAE